MNTPQKDLHIGIYGLIEQEECILVVRKSRGPYKGLFDLPGGRPSHGEPLLEALSREIKEETGIRAQSYSVLGNFSFLVPYCDVKGNQKELYHIALAYRVEAFDFNGFNDSITSEDVCGSLWINPFQLHKENSSPLLRRILKRDER
jgi:8-oxo-dGTP pyrophosphatase MutT (NUDIX family)